MNIGGSMTAAQKKAWEEWLETCRIISKGHQPIRNETNAEKQKRIDRLLKPENFFEFAKYYFPDYCFGEFAAFHREMVDNVLIKKESEHHWELFRESAKSVFANLFIPAQRLVSGWLDGFILASENKDKAVVLIKDLQAHLMHNKRLIHDFGDFGVTGSWLQGHFQTKDGIGFWAFGLGQNPAGVKVGHRRPNMGVIDDADSYLIARNERIVDERVDWIDGEFKGCLRTEESLFIYANNRVHKRGITAKLAGDLEPGDAKNDNYAFVKVPFTVKPGTWEAIIPDWGDEETILQSLIDQGAVPAWPRFTLEQCARKIKSMGRLNSRRQLYHIHEEEGKVFTDDMLPFVKVLELYEYDALVTYCDPAPGESGKGCYRAVGLIGIKRQDIDVIKVWLKQTGNYAKYHRHLAELIEENRGEYRIRNTAFRAKIRIMHWVECNALQKSDVKRQYSDLNRDSKLHWMPRFDTETKNNKIYRVEDLETTADNGHLRFNEAEKNNPHMKELIDQFKGFPDGFIDGPDMVEGGIKKLLKMVKSVGSSQNRRRTGSYQKSNARR